VAGNPSLEELYNLGAHVGNFTFEIGDPTLPTKVAYGADLSLRYRGRRFVGEGPSSSTASTSSSSRSRPGSSRKTCRS
jgi:hypothetical protein